MTRTLVVATRSEHKLREIRRILGDLPGYRIIDLVEAGVPETPDEDAIEAFATFEDNALAKARHFARIVGGPVLADDSGVCVDALDGAPGVRSKRFSGRDDLQGAELDRANNQLLLERLRGVPDELRTAHYVCVAALILPDGAERCFRGSCHGAILHEPRGQGGFGYDPLFWVPEENASFGEIPPERKNRISHRARAMAQAAAALRRLGPA